MDQFVEALRGVDASVQQEFMDRFLKFKGLKRVMAASKQAFMRDITDILGEKGAELAPLVETFYETVPYETLDAALKGEPNPEAETAVTETAVEEPVDATNGHDEPVETFEENADQAFLPPQPSEQLYEKHEQDAAEQPPASEPVAEAPATTQTADVQAPAPVQAQPQANPHTQHIPSHLMPAAPQTSFVDDETAQKYGGEPRVPVVKEEGSPASYILPENRSWNVWIGDVHQDASDDEVIQAFANMGLNINRVRIFKDPMTGKNKGWGFAHFGDRDTMARLLQTDFDPPMVRDRKLKVGPAQERNIIFIGNLSFDTTWVELFNACVDVLGADKISAFELKIKDDGKCRGYGFVTCIDQASADEGRKKLVAARLNLHGREANISWADKEEEATRDVKTMYLANLGEEITEDVLRDLGGKYGAIDKIVIAKDMATGKAKGYAFVEYQRRLDCLKAIQALNNSFMNERLVQASLVKRKGGQQGMGGGLGVGMGGGFGGGPRGRGRGFQQQGWNNQGRDPVGSYAGGGAARTVGSGAVLQSAGWGQQQQWNQGYGQWGAYPGYGAYGAQAAYPQQYAGYPGYQQQAYAGYGQAPQAGADATGGAAYGQAPAAVQGGYAQGYAQRPQGQNNRYQPY